MSNFIDKLQFWKRHEDFSFNDTSSSSFPNTTDTTAFSSGLPPLDSSVNNPLASPQESFGDSSGQSSFDPLSAPSADGDPFASSTSLHPTSSSNPLDSFAPQRGQASSPPLGKKLAREYIGQKDPLQPSWSDQTVQQTQTQNTALSSASTQSMEVVQLKLDAIRSELNAMSQRMIKIEHMLEQQQKKRMW